MTENAFLDRLDEYRTVFHGCYDLGINKIVIAIEDAAVDTPGAKAFVERCSDVTSCMDILIEVLPEVESGDLHGDRVVIRYREALAD